MQDDVSSRRIHPFPARMAPEIALSAIPPKGTSEMVVLDPMCGSGTVLSAALSRGHRAVGIDIDPLAVMMSKVAVDPIDTTQLLDHALSATSRARQKSSAGQWRTDEETSRFIDFWFGEPQRRDLERLASEILVIEESSVRRALQVALSRIIVTKSPQASLAADTSHSRPHRVLLSSDYSVLDGFERSVNQLVRMLAQRTTSGGAEVTLGDARNLNQVADSSIDMAVTSPPYLNALDYLRGHKLALVWFGYSISELRLRRGASIGSERRINGTPSNTVRDMVESISSDFPAGSTMRQGMVQRFADDCMVFASELARVVRQDGSAVLVVGNSTLKGNYIRNDRIAQLAMEHAGFSFADRYEREIPPTNRYMAIGSDPSNRLNKRMRTEVVLTMER